MKKAGYYLRDKRLKDPVVHDDAAWNNEEVKSMIKQAQKDAYNEGYEKALEDVIEEADYFDEDNELMYTSSIDKLRK